MRTAGPAVLASEEESARDARCYTSLRSPTLRLRRGYGATRSWTERGRNVRFYQTNPPIFGSKTAFIHLRYNGLRGKNLSRNGGFVLENEPTGRG